MAEIRKDDIYVSLDEAREELKKRWDNIELRKKVEAELGENFWPSFKIGPRGMLGRCLASPDNGFMFFLQCAHYVGAVPIAIEYFGDTFITINKEKAGLGILRAYSKDNEKILINLIDFRINDKKSVKEVFTVNNKKLVDFHHDLINFSGYNVELYDMTSWASGFGKPISYYYSYLTHFVAHGVLFEYYLMDDANDRDKLFFKEIIQPAFKKIKQIFGINPLIVKLYPDQQDNEEDFYWWSYPPYINEHIIDYAKKNNLSFKHIK